MKEKDILHQNGDYWVCSEKVSGRQHGKKFSFPGYKIYRNLSTHSIEIGLSFKLNRAIAICDHFSETHHKLNLSQA